jgi:hypothetical protein
MAKRILDIPTDGIWADCVLEHYPVQDIEEGKAVWHDKQNMIGSCTERVKAITIYMKDRFDCNKITPLILTAASIKQIAKEIEEIEKIKSNEFIDDLPW